MKMRGFNYLVLKKKKQEVHLHFTFFFYDRMEKMRNSQAPVPLTTADAADPSPVLVWLGAPSPLHPAFWPEPHGTEPDSADQNIACNHSPVSPDITHRSTITTGEKTLYWVYFQILKQIYG